MRTPQRRNPLLALACALAWGAQPAAARSVDLSELSLEDLMKVEITSASKYAQSQAEAPSAVTVVTREDIRRFGWRNLADLLAAQRGFHVIYDRNYHYLGVRGFAPPGDYNSRIMFLIDGMRVNENVYDSAMPDGAFPLDLALIERVEIVRGPGASMYGGNALFGVINIVTRTPDSLAGGEAGLMGGSDGMADIHLTAGGKGEGVAGIVSVNGHRTDGGRYRFDDVAPAQPSPTGADSERWERFFGHIALAGWRAMLVHGVRRKHVPTGSYGTTPDDPRHWEQDGYTLANLMREFRLDDRQSLSVSLSGGRYTYVNYLPYGVAAYGYDMVNRDDVKGEWLSGDIRWTSETMAKHKWVAGLEWAADRTTMRNYDLDGTEYPYPDGPNYSSRRIGLYAQDEIRLTDTLTGTLGLRIDRAQDRDLQVSPRLALVAQIGADDTAKLLYGTAFRNPSHSNDVTAPAGVKLAEERVQSIEAVWEHRFGVTAQLSASLYRYRIDDVIDRAFDAAVPSYLAFNGQPVDARGTEIEYLWHGANGLSLRASYSAQFLDQSGARPANSPQHLGKANLILPLGPDNLLLALEGQAIGGRGTNSGARLSGTAIANTTLSWRNKDWDVAFSVYNLFDRRYDDPSPQDPWLTYYYPGVTRDRFEQDGRSWRLAATLRF